MRRFAMVLCALIAIKSIGADSPPYSITVDFSAKYAPAIEIYQANERVFTVTLVNKGILSITNMTPTMWWAASTNSTQIATGTVSNIIASNGTFTATFSPSQLNTNGTFIYGVGLTGTGPTTARQGQFIIRPDPWAVGAGPITFSQAINWSLYTYANGLLGPYRAGSNITSTVNADGSITFGGQAGASGGTDPLAWHKGDSVTNATDETARAGLLGKQPTGTYVTAESDPVWQAQSSTVWGAISGKQATGDYATVTAFGGYVATGAVGTAAASNADAFATAAQGVKADTAVQAEADPVWVAGSNAVWRKGNSVTNAVDAIARLAVGGAYADATNHAKIYTDLTVSGYVATNGSGSSLTSLDLSPSLTATVAKASSALQSESDTLASVSGRGRVFGLGPWGGLFENGTNIAAVVPDEGFLVFLDGGYTNILSVQGDDLIWGVPGAAKTALATDGSGSSLTGITAAQVGASPTAHTQDWSTITNAPTIPTNNTQLVNGAGYLTNVTAAAIVDAGAVTGTPWNVALASSNLLGIMVGPTCSIPYNVSAPALDQQFYLNATGAVTFIATVANWPTNRAQVFVLDYLNANQTTWDSTTIYSNSAVISTNKINHLILSRGAGQTNFWVKGEAW